ncbi:L-aminoadipate-semialdehyde dehydrogenase-phosphopantetheinyl transferase-like isoform X2 [Amphiura filiformis]|uniref:L-aminoadipate-semialdehyde dehydrogenase-phosphopantetheinyl transferase-like isoform X2 n=1 Tax=Amphiura filiformis TaxID=82378 RepID=UPI003B21335F
MILYYIIFALKSQLSPDKKKGHWIQDEGTYQNLSGRLLIRKVIADQLKIPWNAIKLGRTERGKPYLANTKSYDYYGKPHAANTDSDYDYDAALFPNFNFNLSHSGSYAVLAAERDRNCGIDIMDVARPGSRDIPEFFRLMRRQFTPHEWETIKGAGSEWDQLEMFYRHWCLKESYVKATGTGLGVSLQRIEFHPKTMVLKQDVIIKDTELYFDGDLQSSWRFEETKLDEDHCVAVALNRDNQDEPPPHFKILSFTDLTSSAIPILPEDENFWTIFASKEEKPKRQQRDRTSYQQPSGY